ncbi:MAG: ABC transporter permease [Rhodospirillales bacterium]|nr:ABC transporter permease [Rhodospirillales bacterium]
MVIFQSIFWLVMGRKYRQPVRLGSVVVQMIESGIQALPILIMLNGAIGVMLAIQGIYTLKIFGAESQVTFGIAVAVVREFAPLISGILIAGRTGSSLAARIGTMRINQELDALHVMGIQPIRFLAAPAIFAMVIIIPLVTFFSGAVSLFTAALYVDATLGISISSFFDQVISVLSVGDLMHGMTKSLLFALLIAVIGVVNGASVTGGADGVGKATTRSVVQAISAIVLTDMLFAYIATLS